MHEQKRSSSLRLSTGHQLVPRDINESLGKLPPQALEMEVSVLGAIMLEKPAIDMVCQYLRAEHFYLEQHKEIYAAILSLHADHNPIDMRTVVDILRKTGKIELIGGAYYIAELTSKVSSAANIDYHARVVVEMSIKRSMIELASKIHQQAYGESDCFELLDEGIKELQYLHDSSTLENTEGKIKELWKERQLVEEPPAEIPLITINGVTVCTAENHSLIIGKKKSRKTLFITWLIHQFFLQNKGTENDILLFDTEQGKSHVWKVRKKIKKLTGFELPIFYMRGMSPKERRDFVANTVKYWPKRPRIIVIDGVRDMMSNINDADESTELIVWLEQIILTYNLHICEVLHQNKTDNNARGHIGSELLNKAQVTIELELDEKSGVTIVKCESSRERDFETFSFTHGADDLPEVVGMPIQGVVIPNDVRRDMLIKVFEDGPMKYKELTKEISLGFKVSKNKSESLIREFSSMGWVIKSGKRGDPTTMWKLAISQNGHSEEHSNLIPYAEAVKQAELFDNGVDEDIKPDDMPF